MRLMSSATGNNDSRNGVLPESEARLTASLPRLTCFYYCTTQGEGIKCGARKEMGTAQQKAG